MSITHLELVFIPELAQALEINRQNTRYVISVCRTCAYSSHQVSSRSLFTKRFPRFPFPLHPPMSPNPISLHPPLDGRIGENDYYQVNLCRSLIRVSIFSVLARPEAPNSLKYWKSPQLPQRERIRSNYVNHVSRTCAHSSHQVPSRPRHYKRFPRFSVSLSNFPQCHQIMPLDQQATPKKNSHLFYWQINSSQLSRSHHPPPHRW